MSLRKKTIKGLFWSFFSQGGRQVSQFIITIILARALTPRDFGLVGMVVVLTSFVVYIGELGFSNALVQRCDIDERHLSTVFWLNIAFGIALSLLFILAAPLISFIYRTNEIRPILVVMSLNFIFASFGIIQRTILTKQLNFKALAIRNVFAVIIAGILGIFLAYSGFGVWSLVCQLLTITLVDTVLLWILSSWRPKLIFCFASLKSLFSFSFNKTGSDIADYVSRNIDYFLIGIFLGPVSLGYYTLAYKLMMVPLQNITYAVNRVIFPVFSMIKHDIEKIRRNYLKMIKAITIVTIPIMLGLFIFAHEFILYAYGDKWLPAVGVIRILSLVAILQSIYATASTITLSQGKAKLHFKLVSINTISIIIAVLIGVKWGIYGVAIAYFIQQTVWFFIIQRVVNYIISLKFKDLYLYVNKQLIISAFIGAAIILAKCIFTSHSILSLLLYLGAGFSMYVLFIWIYDRDFILSLVNFYKKSSV